jgi:DNA-binding NarL/FixJ family response regulator
MIRVLIVDDHAMVRAGLEGLLSSFPDIHVVGQAADGDQSVVMVEQLQPDVVLMDIAMPGMSGIEAVGAVRAVLPDVRVIMLTTFADPSQVSAALSAGAAGYLLKDVEPEVLVAGIRATLKGGAPLSPMVAAHLIRNATQAQSSIGALSPRELQTLRLIATGHSNKQIARMMGISEKTVKAHCSRVFQRVGVSDRTQAAVWATRNLPPE